MMKMELYPTQIFGIYPLGFHIGREFRDLIIQLLKLIP